MSQTGMYILLAIGAILLLLALIFLYRAWRFRPTTDKKRQAKELNDDLKTVGFAYNDKEDYFYSLKDSWQREAGYCSLYDQGAPFFNMIMDCEPITFSYGGKRWLIELWKGQYGITTGAEIGIYNTRLPDVKSEKFTGTFYQAAGDDEQMHLAFVLRKNGKTLLRRSGLHWWLTAFKLGTFSEKYELTMTAKITFPTLLMRRAFVDALSRIGYTKDEYAVRGSKVTLLFSNPHTKQPPTQEGLQEDVVQSINKGNCALFETATKDYPETLDKLEYIKHLMPELYGFMLNSLYTKEFFSGLEGVLDTITSEAGDRPENQGASE